ncbi:hypothetical protein MGSAQ_002843 [marine sediment metagenome]|uniref:Uncharacterized protein n=1 Tax=marine sediment metagenome TaxID=412755 RepID=A0A1B6NQE7_9ZZZZ
MVETRTSRVLAFHFYIKTPILRNTLFLICRDQTSV